jgi:uncharacterized membrane protein
MESKYRVSLEVAKQLKENGFPQDWCDGYWYVNNNNVSQLIRKQHFGKEMDIYAAPCVGRLGEELPVTCKTFKLNNNIQYCVHEKSTSIVKVANSEADARALMWIELKKRGII